jgi:hypothetical protein
MPPSNEVIVHRLELIERELAKTQSEYPGESALDRLKFVREMVRLVKSQIELGDEETIPVLDEELRPSKDYRQG